MGKGLTIQDLMKLQTPEPIVNAQVDLVACEAGAKTVFFTLTSSGWQNEGDLFFQEIECADMTGSSTPLIVPQYQTLSQEITQSLSQIVYIESLENTCKVYAQEALTIDLQIGIMY